MDSSGKEVTVDIPGLIRVYKDGTVEKLWVYQYVPPSPEDPDTVVCSKDITISSETGLAARLHLPKLTNPTQNQKLPILVYFHGGGFCVESAFSFLHNRYLNIIASEAKILIVSIEYRQMPEHHLPIAYEDCWAGLNWVASRNCDSWVVEHGDFDCLFIGGDSAGGNIAHNIAMRAGSESLQNGVKILGAFISQPYFIGPNSGDLAFKLWDYIYPNAPGGMDSPMVNPLSPGAPTLAGLGCSRLLVLVAGNDPMTECAVRYYNAVKESGFQGTVDLFEAEGEDHGFHALNPECQNAKLMFQCLASFLQK